MRLNEISRRKKKEKKKKKKEEKKKKKVVDTITYNCNIITSNYT